MTPLIMLVIITLSVLLLFATMAAVVASRVIWHIMFYMTELQMKDFTDYLEGLSLHEFLFKKRS